MIKILIIEDEAPAVRKLISYLEKSPHEVDILDDIDTVEDGIDWLKNNKHPDLIFSDIQLADGISFDIYKAVKPECPIIFTTAYDEYAIKAFELNSIDYLLKPYTQNQLDNALNKLANQNQSVKEEDKIASVLNHLLSNEQKGTYKERFLVNKKGAYFPIKSKDVAYFYTEDKALSLITKSGEHYFLNSSLDELESSLNPSEFYRVNRQFILHIDSINRIETVYSGKLLLEVEPPVKQEIPVSRARATAFKAWLGS